MKILSIFSALIVIIACENVNREYHEELAFTDDFIDVTNSEQPPPPMEQSEGEVTRKLVKTGGLDFQSEDIEADYRKIRDILPHFEAYIQNENQTKSTHRINYDITIRVPAVSYDTLYAALSGIAFRLDNKYSNVSDVTERYYDLKTRIRNKKALEDRYLKLLSKAKEIKDILDIERNLNNVRTNIEHMEGQLKYLSNQISLSTIDLSFYEELPYVYDGPKRKGFGARILNSLDNGWQGLLSFIVGVTTLWPFIIMLIAGFLTYKKWRRSKK